jgi:hypothetical protein
MSMELEQRFPSSQIMNALSVVYLQFWLTDVDEIELRQHLSVIKNVFGQPKEMETTPDKWEWTRELVSPGGLDKELECFRIAMLHNSHHAMRAIDPHIHPLTKLWRNLSLFPMLPGVLPEYFKLAELAMIMVPFSSPLYVILMFAYMSVDFGMNLFTNVFITCRSLGVWRTRGRSRICRT